MRLPPQVFAGSKPDPAKFHEVWNRELFWKPTGGLWTSTHTPEAEYLSGWAEWTTLEDFKIADEFWLLQPADARVAVVATQGDLAALLECYRLEPRQGDLGLACFSALLDYERIADDFDVLTFPAPWGERFRGDYALGMFFSVLDSECSLWLRWAFEGDAEQLRPPAALGSAA